MRRLPQTMIIRLLFIGLLMSGAPVLAVEKILHFDSDIHLTTDGKMIVVETIDVWAEGLAIKRGIYRDFPTRYRNQLALERRTDFEVVSVLLDGEPTAMMRQALANGWRVYMGDKNHYLSHGQHRFQFTYRTNHQLQFFDDHDELYWNVTGNGWVFAINKVTARVHLPDGAGKAIKDIQAWTGYQGQQGDNFEIIPGGDEQQKVEFATTQTLAEHQGLTIGLSFKKGVFQEPGLQFGRFIQHNILWLSTLMSIFGLLFFMVLAWYRHGRDPKKGIIIARFKPPKGISPAAINYLDNQKITNTTLTAAILSLAVKGALRIKQKSQHYRLFKQKPNQSLSKGEKQLFKNLFTDKNDELIINKQPNGKLAKGKKQLALRLKTEYKDACFKNNRRYIIWGWLLSIVCCALFYTLFYGFGFNWGELLAGFLTFVFIFIIAIIFLMTWPVIVGFLFILILVGSITEIMNLFAAVQVGIYFTLVMIGLNILFTRLMQAPTIYGRQIKDQIAGLKLYISMAEEQRLNLMNPPEKNLAHYEALLPYAVALGLENRWAEKFSTVFSAEQETDKTTTDLPFSWYQGVVISGQSFTEQLSGISRQLDNTLQKAADVPASKQSISSSSDGYGSYSSSYSSSSSSSSFSSGGGFSGGGGGGGGGGGW
ncbi:MAG: DUF2207 domain-containing protein [Proteobacteria bacterium]|nr:MAG: DUF2207 domain-containing protein [Pseudomonadota bacterium]